MTLTQEQIKKIAKNLAKIPLDDSKMEKDTNSILKYFEMLGEVNTDNVEPTYCVISKENVLREDTKQTSKASPKELLDCSEQQVISNSIAIPNIMK